jgi:hypothetical protein
MEDRKKIALAYDPDMDLDELWIISSFLQAFWARWALYKFQSTQKPIYKEIADWKISEYQSLVK